MESTTNSPVNRILFVSNIDVRVCVARVLEQIDALQQRFPSQLHRLHVDDRGQGLIQEVPSPGEVTDWVTATLEMNKLSTCDNPFI